MGLEGLQKYIETKLGQCVEKNVDLKLIRNEELEESKPNSKEPLIYVVHAESCKKHVYPMSTDWVCGGQWNEMLNNLEKFVRCFRQSSIELVVFFDGSMSPTRLEDWKQRHKNQRETVKQLMSKVVSNRATPSRSLAVTPACFNAAFRLALKSCNVIVCSSVDEVHRDITNYYRSQKCAGIIAQNSYYLLQRVSNCFLPDHLKVARYLARSSRINFEKAMEELGLSLDSLPVFAALVGSLVLPAGYLATFHWSFLGPDHPLKSDELKGNVSYQTALPPNEVVIKGVAEFLKDKDLTDIESLASEVFKESGYDMKEATTKLKETVEYYKSLLERKDYSSCGGTESCVNQDGYPFHAFGSAPKEPKPSITNSKTIENSYQKRWQQFQKVQTTVQPQAKSAKNEDEEDVKKEENTSIESQVDMKEEKEEGNENADGEKGEKENLEAEEGKAETSDGSEKIVEVVEEKSLEEKDSEEKDSEEKELVEKDPEEKELDEKDSEEKDSEEKELVEKELVEKDPEEKDLDEKDSEEKKLEEGKLEEKVEGRSEENASEEEKVEARTQEEKNLDEKNSDENIPEQNKSEDNVEEKEAIEIDEEKPVVNGVNDESVAKEDESSLEESYDDTFDDLKPIISSISKDVIAIARRRHQSGEMAPEILQILSQGEVVIDTGIDEEYATMRPPIPLLYRPIRQLIYGILYDQKIYEDTQKEGVVDEEEGKNPGYRHVKEYCVHKGNSLDTPDLVEPISMPWDIPPVKNLWLGRQAQDNTMRMKAFLTCLKSDTQNMSNVSMVPQRMLLLCCVLRYLIQQEGGKSILSRHDIDAFLAQALSSHLTTESNSKNLANLKLNQIDVRAMQLASIFMSGVEVAIIANDACGSPVPWEFCCPWLFFDGKLFHSKWLQSSMNVATLELCEGKPKIAERLERLRWCITEGISEQFKVTGLKPVALASGSPFGTPPASLMPATPYGVNNFRPAGANYHGKGLKGRGASSKRQVLASGGTLEVAGVPVAHWSGNKSGIGYNRDNPDIVVGGRNSVDLPSDARGLRRGMGRSKIPNRGRGLLPTPLFSPWPVDYDGMRGVQPSFGRSPGPQMPMVTRGGRPQGRSLYRPGSSTGTRRQDAGYHQMKGKERGPMPGMGKPHPDMWVGKARGRSLRLEDNYMGNNDQRGELSLGRGWNRP